MMNQIKVFEDFIDNKTCNSMISLYDDLLKNVTPVVGDGRKFIKNPQSPDIINFLNIYIPKICEKIKQKLYIREVFISLYETGSYLEEHIDYYDIKLKESLGVLFYFNDDFLGGDLYFPQINKSYKPKQGSVIIFPCNKKEYKHGVSIITSGKRYAMPIELTLIKELKVY